MYQAKNGFTLEDETAPGGGCRGFTRRTRQGRAAGTRRDPEPAPGTRRSCSGLSFLQVPGGQLQQEPAAERGRARHGSSAGNEHSYIV